MRDLGNPHHCSSSQPVSPCLLFHYTFIHTHTVFFLYYADLNFVFYTNRLHNDELGASGNVKKPKDMYEYLFSWCVCLYYMMMMICTLLLLCGLLFVSVWSRI